MTPTFLVVGLFGCTSNPGDTGQGRERDPGTPSDTATDTGADSGTNPVLLPSTDEVLAAAEGGNAGLLSLSQTYGFPVETVDGWVFLAESDAQLSLAGEFTDWTPEAMRCANGLCAAVYENPQGGYKFVSEGNYRADPWSRSFEYDENGEMSLVQASGAHLERHFGVKSQSLEARTVQIWVPAGTVRHTLYAHDGQNLFNPEGIYGGWRLQSSVPDGMLVVGIDNTPARMDEYTHVVDHLDGDAYGGKGDEYADLIHDEVRPLVRQWYGEASTVGVLGSSLGGLISLHVALRYPGEFAFAASMSGTLGWGSIEDHNATIIERYANEGHGSTAIYLDSGGNGGTCADSDQDGVNDDDPTASDNYCETLQMRDTLSAAGYTFDTDLWHWHEPDAGHNEVEWAARVWRPLELFGNL